MARKNRCERNLYMLPDKSQAPSLLGLVILVTRNWRARTWCRSSGISWCPSKGGHFHRSQRQQRQQQHLFTPSCVPRKGLLYIFPRGSAARRKIFPHSCYYPFSMLPSPEKAAELFSCHPFSRHTSLTYMRHRKHTDSTKRTKEKKKSSPEQRAHFSQ